MNNEQQRPAFGRVDKAIDELEKSVIVAQAELGDRVPLRELHNLAGKCLEVETVLLEMLTDFGDDEEVAEVVARSFSRLCELDYHGHSFRDLVDHAEAAAFN